MKGLFDDFSESEEKESGNGDSSGVDTLAKIPMAATGAATAKPTPFEAGDDVVEYEDE